jgi:hypothetical protein
MPSEIDQQDKSVVPTLTGIEAAQAVKIIHEAGPKEEGGKQQCRRCGVSLVLSPWPLLPEGRLVQMTPTGRAIYHSFPEKADYAMCDPVTSQKPNA